MSDSAATQKLEETKQQGTEPGTEPKPGQDTDKQKDAETDKQLAIKMADAIQRALDKIQPILKLITEVRLSSQTPCAVRSITQRDY